MSEFAGSAGATEMGTPIRDESLARSFFDVIRVRLEAEDLGLKRVGNTQAIVRADFAQDSMNVILHGLFGEIQLVRYFLVSHAALNHGDQLLFTPGQSKLCARGCREARRSATRNSRTARARNAQGRRLRLAQPRESRR